MSLRVRKKKEKVTRSNFNIYIFFYPFLLLYVFFFFATSVFYYTSNFYYCRFFLLARMASDPIRNVSVITRPRFLQHSYSQPMMDSHKQNGLTKATIARFVSKKQLA